ncbi:hypothetical protein [Microvirga sp. VF16]|uniref:hypothetical protein n=1 Tax=Microvirga sp. VF16 TaxID=2807101 RepID=UPI00193CB66C|nr:hypothetical protein [Microvirga sp. VF16]QRM34921.1 hypothetical protein JO965_42435 [Microvirga sp. VF16]
MKFLHMLISLTVLLLMSSGLHAQSVDGTERLHKQYGLFDKGKKALEVAKAAPLVWKARHTYHAISAGCDRLFSKPLGKYEYHFDRWYDQFEQGTSAPEASTLDVNCCALRQQLYSSRWATELLVVQDLFPGFPVDEKSASAPIARALDVWVSYAGDKFFDPKDIISQGRHDWNSLVGICPRVIKLGVAK